MKSVDINSKEAINVALTALETGGLVIFPTETTYGAGVDATNPEAVQKLLEFKSRREGKPLSIAVPDLESAARYVEINSQAKTIYQQFLPGPVTVVSKGLGKVAPGVESEFGTLGVRIPDYDFVIKLLKKFGKPITATSANPSGGKRPYFVPEILEELSGKQKSLVDLVVDAGRLPNNPPSTVIDTTLSIPVTLRQGKPKIGSKDSYQLKSTSETETKEIAGKLILNHWSDVGKTGLIIGLDGDLGMGKTVFAKGAAEFLHISETISSPTYSYIHEYDYARHQTTGMFYHLDMWKVDTLEMFEKLEVKELLKPNNIVVIEWFSQIEPYMTAVMPEKYHLIKVNFSGQDSQRTLAIQDN